ncbi:MAG: hypothetical protein FJ265_17460, partial [Planctomycetes bacterium]|nr:hypothetical protein [Planctomycetota bacterium]
MRTTLIALSAALALPAAATAQRLAAYDPFVAMFTELQPPTALLPAPVGPVAGYPSVPALPPLGSGTIAMPGDSTWNGRIGYHWFTNGAVLAAMATPTFPPLGPLPVPPVFPITPAVLAMLGNMPVTGIALNTAANVMFLCNAAGVTVGVTPTPAMPVVVPPFAPLFPVPTGPITGLEYDRATNSLYYVDVPGV